MKELSVGITGYTGFIGSHLVDRLSRESTIRVVPIDDELFSSVEQLKQAVAGCDCVVHLAGMNRGKEEDIYSTNIDLAKALVSSFEGNGQSPHLIFSSSILAGTDSAFGRSKKESCRIFEEWAKKNKAPASLLTIPNVFGDRGKPFYNSVVATFCHQLARGEKPKIIQDREVEFIYINDLIETMISAIRKPPKGANNYRIKGKKKIAVSALLSILERFRDQVFDHKVVPSLSEPFLVDLYNVFLSYLEEKDRTYQPKINSDERGRLFEIIKLAQGGQVFFSTSRPGVIRGNHYHARKIERFCVVKGKAAIRLRRIGTDKIIEHMVDSDQPSFIDIPIFHAHHIENTGEGELETLFWCNELFDPNDTDTYPEEVVIS